MLEGVDRDKVCSMMDVTIPFWQPYDMILCSDWWCLCLCEPDVVKELFKMAVLYFFIALCTLHSFLCFFCLIVFMHWQVQYLDFPEYQLRALWTSVVNMHRHTHFHLDVVGDYVVVIAACVSGVWFKWYRFIAFIYSATQIVFRSAFFEISAQVIGVIEQDLSLNAKEVLTGKLIFLIGWEYFVCVFCQAAFVFVCFTRMLFCRGSILALPAFSFSCPFFSFSMLLSLSEKVAICSVQ